MNRKRRKINLTTKYCCECEEWYRGKGYGFYCSFECCESYINKASIIESKKRISKQKEKRNNGV